MTPEEARTFISEQVKTIGIGFHIDTPYNDYIDSKTKEPLFTDEEAEALDMKLNAAVDALEVEGIDAYGFALHEMRKELIANGQGDDTTMQMLRRLVEGYTEGAATDENYRS